jgi:hypothetical protein
MNLEMGESLVFSWLRHEKHCQIVQMNWKTSPEWDVFVNNKELDRLYKKANKLFDFSSAKDSDKLIKQGEVDVIGIELDVENPGTIKNIHAVDVAFHEAGLNYGQETMERIIKKYIRTALSVYKFFGCKVADIYFVTPNTQNLHRSAFAKAKDAVNDFFIEEKFNFSFHFYSNEDFYKYIFVPVERISTTMTDTSELFARSLKLVRLMHEESKKNVDEIDTKEEVLFSLHEEKKIGLIVRESFDNLSHNQLLSEEMINSLRSKEYSKNTFQLKSKEYSVLIDDEDQCFDGKGHRRYYATPYNFNGTEYFLLNNWYDSNKDKFIEWYNQIINK